MHSELPQPSSAALAHSTDLSDLIRARIQAEGGWISFDSFMQLALYAPGLGYYSAGATKFGESGDFVTAPEISPIFSRCVARQCAEVLASLGGGSILEPGAGSGVMAADMLLELDRVGCLPDEYLILETSAELRERQRARISELTADLAARVIWLDMLPAEPIRGVIVANEVADALPVRRFCVMDKEIGEVGVSIDGTEFSLARRSADAEFVALVKAGFGEQGLPDGDYYSELSPALPGWIASLGDCLSAGLMLLFDYGFSRREYYLHERRSGTLRCYYRHRAHEDALLWPGLQDITAWVDFSRLADAASDQGLHVAGYTTQAAFLLASGIDSLVAEAMQSNAQQQVTLAAGLRKLMVPGEMGEAIKVIALSKAGVQVPSGMQGRDMRAAL